MDTNFKDFGLFEATLDVRFGQPTLELETWHRDSVCIDGSLPDMVTQLRELAAWLESKIEKRGGKR